MTPTRYRTIRSRPGLDRYPLIVQDYGGTWACASRFARTSSLPRQLVSDTWASVHVIDAGHLAVDEAPVLVAGVCRDFLDEIESAEN